MLYLLLVISFVITTPSVASQEFDSEADDGVGTESAAPFEMQPVETHHSSAEDSAASTKVHKEAENAIEKAISDKKTL